MYKRQLIGVHEGVGAEAGDALLLVNDFTAFCELCPGLRGLEAIFVEHGLVVEQDLARRGAREDVEDVYKRQV